MQKDKRGSDSSVYKGEVLKGFLEVHIFRTFQNSVNKLWGYDTAE